MYSKWMHENLEILTYLIPHMNFRLTKKDFNRTFHRLFSQYLTTWFSIVVRQEVSNFDISVVVHELELAINRALYGFLIECRKSHLVFINTYSKPGGIMENMVIDDRLLFFGSLFISLSAT